MPDVGSVSPLRQAIVVLLPDPFEPRKPNRLPARTLNVSDSIAVTFP